MENLNAEHIKNVLEVEIGFSDGKFTKIEVSVLKDALALINSQEQRIKELTEENERLRASSVDYRNIPHIRAEAKADAVRKMQERLKAEMRNTAKYSFGGREYSVIGEAFIDQIAKEMLEGRNE